jgi:hypothetical protein
VPLVAGQRADCPGHVVGDGRQVHLGEPGLGRVLAGEGVALGGQCLVEHGPHLVEGASEVATAAGGLAEPADPLGEIVEAASSVEAAAHQLPQGLAEAATGEDVVADLVERRPHVERRCERVRAAGPR